MTNQKLPLYDVQHLSMPASWWESYMAAYLTIQKRRQRAYSRPQQADGINAPLG